MSGEAAQRTGGTQTFQRRPIQIGTISEVLDVEEEGGLPSCHEAGGGVRVEAADFAHSKAKSGGAGHGAGGKGHGRDW